MIQELTIVLLTLLIPFLIFNLIEGRQERLKKMKEEPMIDPSWIATILSLVETKSVTIDNFCNDYKLNREDFQKFISCEKIAAGKFFYICGLLELDWKRVQEEK